LIASTATIPQKALCLIEHYHSVRKFNQPHLFDFRRQSQTLALHSAQIYSGCDVRLAKCASTHMCLDTYWTILASQILPAFKSLAHRERVVGQAPWWLGQKSSG